MGTANRVALSTVRESTLGTTPTTPRMRAARFTGEALAFNQEFVDSGEIRSDRMLGDPAKVFAASQGSINFEMSYPVDNSPESTSCARPSTTPGTTRRRSTMTAPPTR
jgi:hypothetical protein